MIPYSTDAPLYHRPLATGALILLNAVLFFTVPSRQLQLPSPPAGHAPGDFDRFAPPDQPAVGQEAGQAARGGQWEADAFSVVEEPLPAEDHVPNADAPKVGAGGRPQVDAAADARLSAAGKASSRSRAPLTLALEHGLGLKPWQWITSLFVHSGFVQLLLNLLCLWAFGLIVEGKVGGRGLLTIYLGIGVAQAALEQTLSLWAAPAVSMGANAALLGLLGVAVVWAPRNDFDVLWGFGVRGGTLEIPVLMFGFIQLAVELIGVASGGFGITTSLMHLVGLAMGIAVGAIWLRRGWVDCEGWDLVNVWHGRETGMARDAQVEAEARALVRASVQDRDGRLGPAAAAAASTKASARPASPRPGAAVAGAVGPDAARREPATKATKAIRATKATKTTRATPGSARRPWSPKSVPQAATLTLTAGQQRLQVVERAIAESNLAVALKLYAKLQVTQPEEQLSQAALFELIKLLLKAKDYQLAIPLLRQHIARFAEQRLALQLNLAQLLLYLQRPRKSLEVLHALRPEQCDAAQRATWQELLQHAQIQIDDGTLELSE